MTYRLWLCCLLLWLHGAPAFAQASCIGSAWHDAGATLVDDGAPFLLVAARNDAGASLRRIDIGTGANASAVRWDTRSAVMASSERTVLAGVAEAGAITTVALGHDLAQGALATLYGHERAAITRLQAWRDKADASSLGDSGAALPLLVGAPSAEVQDPGYAQFYASVRQRRQVVYLGASDGMLHGFDAASGRELFAYVPPSLLAALAAGATLAPFDASAGAAEVRASAGWRTVLVSGMGPNASGVFALDVSEPLAAGGGPAALWEFSADDDRAMGQVRTAPQFVTLGGVAGARRDFVLVTSGAVQGAPALFLLALDKPARQPWRAGVNYFRLAVGTGTGTGGDSLAPPALATAADGTLRHIYTGDSQGHLWRFDVQAGKPSQQAHLVFVARDARGRRQVISGAIHAVFASGGGYTVLFGAGKAAPDSPGGEGEQFDSFYAVRDAAGASDVPLGRGDLVVRNPYAAGSASGMADLEPLRHGWLVDFPRAGQERGAGATLLPGGAVLVTSFIPGAGQCSMATQFRYVFDTGSGAPLTAASTQAGRAVAQLWASLPLVLTRAISSAAPNATGGVPMRARLTVVTAGPNGQIDLGQEIETRWLAGRLSWRELANWQYLHRLAGRVNANQD